jgi:uncharacterized membrane protein YphA (DoxX/SURF4 family)
MLMKIATHIVRYLLGAAFFVFGLNGFLNFIPPPAEMPEAAGEFVGAMVKTGYLMTLVKATEVTVGALLLSGFFVPLALVVLAPVIVNIVLFHVYLTPPSDSVGAFVFLSLYLFLVWQYREHYRGLFAMKAQPAGCSPQAVETRSAPAASH